MKLPLLERRAAQQAVNQIKNQPRFDRDIAIVKKHSEGVKRSALALEFGLSPGYISEIINKAKTRERYASKNK